MKKLLLLLLTISLSTVFAKGGHKSSEELCAIEHMVPLTDLTPEVFKELLKGRLPSTAIECHENMSFPVAYLMKSPLFSLECAPNLTIKILKSCYFRVSAEKQGYFSLDLKTWEKPNRALLDTSFGISADKSHFIIETSENPDYKLRK